MKGVPLAQALNVSGAELGDTPMGPVIEQLVIDIRNRQTLSQAMGRRAGIFCAEALALVIEGQKKGQLDTYLRRIVEQWKAGTLGLP